LSARCAACFAHLTASPKVCRLGQSVGPCIRDLGGADIGLTGSVGIDDDKVGEKPDRQLCAANKRSAG